MDQVSSVIVEKPDQLRVDFCYALSYDAVVLRHVNDERMWRDKTELQRNLTRFFDL